MEIMTSEQLLYNLSNFPLRLSLALLFFFLPLRKKDKWYLYLPLIGLMIAGIIGLSMMLFAPSVNVGFPPLIFFALHFCLIFMAYGAGICLMSKATHQEAAYCVVCAYMTQHLSYCIGLIANHLSEGVAWWNPELMGWIGYVLVCAAVYLLFIHRICRDGHYPVSALKALSLYIFVMAVMFFLSLFSNETPEGWLHGVYTSLMIVVLMYEELHSAEQLRLQGEIQTREHMESLHRAQYEMSKENIAILNRKSHDLRRQVAALRTIGTPEERAEAVEEIEKAVEIYDSTFQTGSRALDTVLMQKALLCGQHHIELSVVADGTLLRFMKSVDLFTMVSNLLDNAIEANLRIPEEEKRTIHLSVHEKKGLVILQCENPYVGEIEMKDGFPVTVKKDKENHGIGTRSIAATATDYGGVMRIDPRGGMYVLRIIFQPPDTNQDEKTTS